MASSENGLIALQSKKSTDQWAYNSRTSTIWGPLKARPAPPPAAPCMVVSVIGSSGASGPVSQVLVSAQHTEPLKLKLTRNGEEPLGLLFLFESPRTFLWRILLGC